MKNPSVVEPPPIEEVVLEPEDEDLNTPNAPYLPTNKFLDCCFKYTLVLDLDETLIHYEDAANEDDEEGYYMVRPQAINFLK